MFVAWWNWETWIAPVIITPKASEWKNRDAWLATDGSAKSRLPKRTHLWYISSTNLRPQLTVSVVMKWWTIWSSKLVTRTLIRFFFMKVKTEDLWRCVKETKSQDQRWTVGLRYHPNKNDRNISLPPSQLKTNSCGSENLKTQAHRWAHDEKMHTKCTHAATNDVARPTKSGHSHGAEEETDPLRVRIQPPPAVKKKKNNFLSPSQMDSAKIRLCKCFAHSSYWATFPVGELLLVGPMVVVLTSLLGSAYFPEHLRPAAPASTADVDLSVHFYTSVAICPRRLLEAQISAWQTACQNFFRELWPTIIIHFGRFDECPLHARLSCSERQFVNLLSDGNIVFMNFGLTTLSTSLYPSTSPRFTRLMLVHIDELPQPIRAVEPALFLQTLEKIASHQMVSINLQIDLHFGNTSARNTFASLASVPSWRLKTLFGSRQLYWQTHDAYH